jgi:CelD/BcsL family acetyltransferase involved in cellulose biosynthesis
VSVQVKVVESLNALEAIAPAWQALDEQTFPRLPFTGPRWNLLWWKHFAESRRTVTDRIQSFVLFDDNQLLAVAPMMLTERPAVGPLPRGNQDDSGASIRMRELRRARDAGRA